jgi:hypothetical protein
MHYISCLAHKSPTIFTAYTRVIQQKISNHEEEEAFDHHGGLLSPCPNILEALTLIRRRRHHHHLPSGLLLRLLLSLLLPPVPLLLPSSIDIASQCSVVLLRLLKFFLDRSQFIF